MLRSQPYLDLVGQTVRDERERRGWSLTNLTERALLNRSHLSQVERGRKCFSMETLVQMAQALDVSPLFLMCSKDRPLRALLRSPEPLVSEHELMEILARGVAGSVIHRPTLEPELLRDFAEALLECPGKNPVSQKVLETWLAQTSKL